MTVNDMGLAELRAEVLRLNAECERLWEALESIVNCGGALGSQAYGETVDRIARAALVRA